MKENWKNDKYDTVFEKKQNKMSIATAFKLESFKLNLNEKTEKKGTSKGGCLLKKDKDLMFEEEYNYTLEKVALPDNHFWGDINGRN